MIDLEIIMFILPTLALILWAIMTWKKKSTKEKIPPQSVPARLISKSISIVPIGYASRSVPYLTFQLPGGLRKDFEVDMTTYNMFLEGEEGMLTFKEQGKIRVFLYFQRSI